MLDHEPTGGVPTSATDQNDQTDRTDQTGSTATTGRRRVRKATKPAESGASSPDGTNQVEVPAGTEPEAAPKKKATRSRRKAAAPAGEPATAPTGADGGEPEPKPRTRRRKAAATAAAAAEPSAGPAPATGREANPATASAVLFMAPEPVSAAAAAAGDVAAAEPAETTRKRRRSRRAGSDAVASGWSEAEPAVKRAAKGTAAAPEPAGAGTARGGAAGLGDTGAGDPGAGDAASSEAEPVATGEASESDQPDGSGLRSRRRGRRGRGRGKGTPDGSEPEETGPEALVRPAESGSDGEDAGAAETGTVTRRRRKRRRRGSGGGEAEPAEDGVHTVVKVREPRGTGDEVRGVTGSTRLEAKRQRRRGGRDQRRTRPPVLSESEFLARREAVDRVMVIRQTGARTQIGVLEDGVLVEHYVSRASSASMVGSVYLGKVQNVLPSMEAAFVDVGRGRNAVLYAGEVNWEASGLEGKARSIEQALSSGDSVLVQVTKDPVGHKGARLTSNLALSGRHLVYTPYGNASGISRKLPDTERRRLRDVLKNLVPDGAGVIVRTAAESASAEELERDVKRLQSQWEDIQAKAAGNHAPSLLYSEPDLVVRVVRDLFNEDFRELVIEGEDAYETVEAYLAHVSPDLVPRLRRHAATSGAFATYRIDEQILKGLDRKVFLPSGGHLVFDRTEAMTVIDVNTGKYTGAGGNLEETVTRNNLEAAEEIVRQLRLRDIGGIIVIDFIDMVLESNRDLVLRRLTECLGRDRTKHQVTEITSLGLVQMTRKRVGAGLLEAFSEPCECCKGRGVVVHTEPVDDKPRPNGAAAKVKEVASASSGRRRGGRKAAAAAGRTTGRAAQPAPAVVDDRDETMGYDLSRYEPVSPPAVAEPVPGYRSPGGEAGPDGPPSTAGPDGQPDPVAEPAPVPEPDPVLDLLPESEDRGPGSVFRRFRRRGGRHRP